VTPAHLAKVCTWLDHLNVSRIETISIRFHPTDAQQLIACVYLSLQDWVVAWAGEHEADVSTYPDFVDCTPNDTRVIPPWEGIGSVVYSPGPAVKICSLVEMRQWHMVEPILETMDHPRLAEWRRVHGVLVSEVAP